MPDDSLYPFTARNMALNGHNLSYLDQGSGKIIVMLHGNPTWSFYYRNLVKLLQDRYRVIVPDHMGCGLSDKPQHYAYTLKTHIDNLEKLLAGCKAERYSLVVHDWGGPIGMGLARRFPERVESLVVLNTAAFRSSKIPLRIRLCRVPLLGDVLVRGLNGFVRGALSMAVVNKMAPEVAGFYLKPYNSWSSRIAILRFVQDIPLSARNSSWPTLVEIENNLTRLQHKPMLILWGGRDFCFTAEFYRKWLQRFPGAQHHYFPDAGHYVLEDVFDEIAPRISTFFRKSIAE